MIKEITVNTWNKWFKTEVFQTIAKELPKDNEIVAMEDEFWNRIFLRRVNKLLIMNTTFYDHKLVGLSLVHDVFVHGILFAKVDIN